MSLLSVQNTPTNMLHAVQPALSETLDENRELCALVRTLRREVTFLRTRPDLAEASETIRQLRAENISLQERVGYLETTLHESRPGVRPGVHSPDPDTDSTSGSDLDLAEPEPQPEDDLDLAGRTRGGSGPDLNEPLIINAQPVSEANIIIAAVAGGGGGAVASAPPPANLAGLVPPVPEKWKTSTKLDLTGKKLRNIRGLSQCTQVTILHLSNNQITDVTPLASLTGLTTLWLNGNQITDVTPLASLTQLTVLWLGVNQITDLTPLAALTQLTTLWLEDNQITDRSPLDGLQEGGCDIYW